MQFKKKHRPLTQGERARLRDEFLVEFAYNSNAIEGNTLTLRETALALEGVTIDKKPLKDHLVPGQMKQLMSGQKGNRRHPIENAALFHLDFEGIHPFIDGNGRTGRLILT